MDTSNVLTKVGNLQYEPSVPQRNQICCPFFNVYLQASYFIVTTPLLPEEKIRNDEKKSTFL